MSGFYPDGLNQAIFDRAWQCLDHEVCERCGRIADGRNTGFEYLPKLGRLECLCPACFEQEEQDRLLAQLEASIHQLRLRANQPSRFAQQHIHGGKQ
jgi:hypothetical protein